MKLGWLVVAIWAAVGLMSPARAALIFEQTGTLAQLSPQTNYDPIGGSTALISTIIPLANVPSSIPPRHLGSYSGPPDPSTPWVLQSPIFHYTVAFLSSVPLLMFGSEQIQGEYYNDFAIVGGTPEYRGGDDNCGGYCPAPDCSGSCLAAYSGNRVTFSFTSQDTASWTCGGTPSGPGCEEFWSYLNGVLLVGEIPISDIVTLPELNTPFSLMVFAAVPEPSTWAIYILGLGAVGLTLRVRRQRRNVPASRPRPVSPLKLMDFECNGLP